ncbi:MAG TPA: D-alanyl-D-alanine carboxypeptidase/D-alanyl-D-alanine-endopeptidase [Vicinamibacterales bacterium]|nr:D-alanyl-D-alanine carboxypeptidase/D-alanyl-D-alanine-endopeptidase [Vicinamibacterales bacterium]
MRGRWARELAFIATFAALGSASCAAKSAAVAAAPAAPATAVTAETQLARDLRAIFSDPVVDHGIWSVAVKSLRSGETLYTSNANRLQVPASNQKVLTTAVAAERLGWDYRYTTRIYSTGTIDPATGLLSGDLIVASDGDPTINPRHPERWAIFDEWGKQLAAKGIRTISGHLIGDDNAFEEPGWGLGWAWDDFAFGYGAQVSALQYNENQVELMIGPGQEAGARGVILVTPTGSGLTIDHRVTTVAAGEPNRINLRRVPGSDVLVVEGQVALGTATLTEYAAILDPTRTYLNAMRIAFRRQGVNIERTPMDIDDVRPTPDMTGATLLVEDRSPALSELIDVTLKWSRNIYAETMLRSLSPAGTPATDAGGLAAVGETLGSWGIAPELYLARDGSGLSRYDFLTADALTGLLTHLWNDPTHLERYRAALPVTGINGNLANRLKDTPAHGRVWAKTGSMSQVRSLSGYLVTQQDEPLVFAFLVTGFRVPQRAIDAAMDSALLRLVSFTHPARAR